MKNKPVLIAFLIVILLAAGAIVTFTFIAGGQTFAEAVRNNELNVIKAQLMFGFDLEQQIPAEGPGEQGCAGTPLEYAVEYGSRAAVELLIEAGAKPAGCSTVIHAAVRSPRPDKADIIQMLVTEHGIGPDLEAGGAGHTALQLAAGNCDADMVKLLLELGADPEKQEALETGEMFTPLMHALSRQSYITTEKEEDACLESARLLIQYGADLDRSVGGSTTRNWLLRQGRSPGARARMQRMLEQLGAL